MSSSSVSLGRASALQEVYLERMHLCLRDLDLEKAEKRKFLRDVVLKNNIKNATDSESEEVLTRIGKEDAANEK